MKLTLLLCAKEVVIDQSTQMTSIIGLIDDIATVSFPLLLPQVSLFALFVRSPREAERQQVRLEIEGGSRTIVSQDLDLNFHGKQKLRQTVIFSGFPIESPGAIEITVKAKGVVLGTRQITATQSGPIRPQQVEPPTSASAHAERSSVRRKKKTKRGAS
jgi:hypothetical protein